MGETAAANFRESTPELGFACFCVNSRLIFFYSAFTRVSLRKGLAPYFSAISKPDSINFFAAVSRLNKLTRKAEKY